MVRKFERTAVLLALVASPFWLPAIPSHLGHSLRTTVSDSLTPAFEALHAARNGVGHVGSAALEWMTVFEENRILRAQMETLQAHEQTHRDLYQENLRLRRLLEFRERTAWATLPAEVIGREIGPWSRSLLVNKGSRSGVREGMAVITPLGLVGRVGEVGGTSSRVVLMTDPHFRVTGMLLQSRVSVLVAGEGNGEITLTYLPLDLEIKPGERVLTAGGKSFCPDGIPVGTIRKDWVDRSQLFRSARVQPAVDPGAVEEVLIVAWRPSESGRSS